MAGMTEEQFIELVKKAEAEAENNIGLYKTKLALFAMLGYVVIFSILFSLVLLIGGTIAMAFVSSALFILLLKKKLIILLLPAIWIMLKALWVRFEAPTGYLLSKQDFAEIWQEVEQLSKKLKSEPIHQIILTPELNASINQTPRLGVFGWQMNTLTLGLELLLIASPEEIRSVIAHELGHLSGNHSKFNGWIYRVRLTWHRLMEAFQHSDSIGARIMRYFFNWYSPKFEAYSFALARSNEYEADAISVELTSPSVATCALVNVYASSPYIDEQYWDAYYKKADHLPEPEHAPYAGLVEFVSSNTLTTEAMINNIREAMQVTTQYHDTHPSLKDRVEAIGADPVLPKPVKFTAAHAWLGKRFDQVLKDFDKEWYESNGDRWRERYNYVTESNAKLDEYISRDQSKLSDEELWQYAMLTIEFKSDDVALPIYKAYKIRQPDDPDVDYMIGQILYRQDDENCLEFLRNALKRESLIVNACEYAYYFLMAHKRENEANEWHEIASKQMEKEDAAKQERSSATLEDEYIKPDLNDAINEVLQQVANHKRVKKIWIAEKKVEYYPDSPVYIIAFTPKGFYTSYESVQEQVSGSIETDEDVFIIVKAGDFKKLAKKVVTNGIPING